MISCEDFFKILDRNDFHFFAGVPDSLLKNLCAYITDHVASDRHIIAANEGNAVAIAAGFYLATGKIPVVYLQNSGLGNTVNPLTSLASPEVYGIPMLLLIGWRGEPGIKDEPQHIQMGKVQNSLLQSLEIPFSSLEPSARDADVAIQDALDHFDMSASPYALLIHKGTFTDYQLKKTHKTNHPLNREDVLHVLVPEIGNGDVIVATTGKTSRELFELRETRGEGHERDFLCVGNMGHTSSLAFGIAVSRPKKRIWCFDGDGSFIMHMGASAIIGQVKPKNFVHVVINNFAHDSVGGQPTAASICDLPAIAKAQGYNHVFSASAAAPLFKALKKIKTLTGPIFLEIRCNKGSRANLGRPTKTPRNNKRNFIKHLRD